MGGGVGAILDPPALPEQLSCGRADSIRDVDWMERNADSRRSERGLGALDPNALQCSLSSVAGNGDGDGGESIGEGGDMMQLTAAACSTPPPRLRDNDRGASAPWLSPSRSCAGAGLCRMASASIGSAGCSPCKHRGNGSKVGKKGASSVGIYVTLQKIVNIRLCIPCATIQQHRRPCCSAVDKLWDFSPTILLCCCMRYGLSMYVVYVIYIYSICPTKACKCIRNLIQDALVCTTVHAMLCVCLWCVLVMWVGLLGELLADPAHIIGAYQF